MKKSGPCLKNNVFMEVCAGLLFQICSVFKATVEFLPFSYSSISFFQLLIPMSIPPFDLVICIRTLASLDLRLSSRDHNFSSSSRSLGELTTLKDSLIRCL
uniref:Uncharacterized protein n=1 Tax=Mus musculus TaxID=10090 RepID=Q3UWI5_MOUSE|nr:unnamed protein product [Mus musculus]